MTSNNLQNTYKKNTQFRKLTISFFFYFFFVFIYNYTNFNKQHICNMLTTFDWYEIKLETLTNYHCQLNQIDLLYNQHMFRLIDHKIKLKSRLQCIHNSNMDIIQNHLNRNIEKIYTQQHYTLAYNKKLLFPKIIIPKNTKNEIQNNTIFSKQDTQIIKIFDNFKKTTFSRSIPKFINNQAHSRYTFQQRKQTTNLKLICKICHKGPYATRDYLLNHIKRSHCDVPWVCRFCYKKLTKFESLVNHVKRGHCCRNTQTKRILRYQSQ